MNIGQEVEVSVNGGQWCTAQIIAIYEDMVTVAGVSEVNLAALRGTRPLGICLPLNLVRAKEKAKTS